MSTSTFGLKRKFTYCILFSFFLVVIGVFDIVSKSVQSHAVEHKIELVELTIANAAATVRQYQEELHTSVPFKEQAVLPLVLHLNNLLASNYFIWDEDGKLIYQASNKENVQARLPLVYQENSFNKFSLPGISNAMGFGTNKPLQILTSYRNPVDHKTYHVALLFPYSCIAAHQNQVIKAVLYLFFAIFLILYLLHFRVLVSVSNRLNRKKENIFNQNKNLIDSFDTSIQTLVSTIDARDSYTAEHSIRVMNYTKVIGEKMGLSAAQIAQLMTAAQLHDIGKIGMPDSVLLKQGALSNDEYDLIKTHPDVGIAILKHHSNFGNILSTIRYHHERYDGKGYPCGLSAEEIPLESRIIAVADAYDAMTTNRPYRTSLSESAARQELFNNSGTQFDPEITDIFLKILTMEDKIDSKPLMAGLYLVNAGPWGAS